MISIIYGVLGQDKTTFQNSKVSLIFKYIIRAKN